MRWVLLGFAACNGDGGEKGDGGGGGPLDGTWAGRCAGELASTTTSSATPVDYGIELVLAEADGHVTGEMELTNGSTATTPTPYVRTYALDGSFDGEAVAVSTLGTTTGGATTVAGLFALGLVLDGERLDGELDTGLAGQDLRVECHLDRVG